MSGENRLGELSVLCQQMRDAARAVVDAESVLNDRKKDLLRLATEDIPELMSELGLEKLRLETGEELTVAREVYASIPKANYEHAMQWLEDKGFGGLIKTELNVYFDRGAQQAALDAYEEMRAKGFEAETHAAVHPQTLKAFIKERLEANAEFPMELFGARAVNTAKIKPPKKSKAKTSST